MHTQRAGGLRGRRASCRARGSLWRSAVPLLDATISALVAETDLAARIATEELPDGLSLHAHAARWGAEGLERELQSAWEAAGAQRAWLAELQEDLAAALEDGEEQRDTAAALAEEVAALQARLAGALRSARLASEFKRTPLRQALHGTREGCQEHCAARPTLNKDVDVLGERLQVLVVTLLWTQDNKMQPMPRPMQKTCHTSFLRVYLS